jgi:hypothetical protein
MVWILGASKKQTLKSDGPQMRYNVRQEGFPYSATLVIRQQSQNLNLTRMPVAVAIADDAVAIYAYVPNDATFLNLFRSGLCRDPI